MGHSLKSQKLHYTENLDLPIDLKQMKSKMETVATKSRLGLGTGTLGTLGQSADARQVGNLLDTMLANGITVIDTADSYGSGHAERLLGADLQGRRKHFFLMTKVGYRYGDLPWPLHLANPFVKKALHLFGRRQCFEPDYLSGSLRGSLRRLQTDYVDVYFLHDPALADLGQSNLSACLRGMREQGIVRQLGISSGKPEVIRAALATGWVNYLQCPANLHDIGRLHEELKLCDKMQVTVIANHVLGCGNFGIPELTHEVRIRATAGLLPESAVILCGTKNPQHLLQSHQWVQQPLEAGSAVKLLDRVRAVHA